MSTTEGSVYVLKAGEDTEFDRSVKQHLSVLSIRIILLILVLLISLAENLVMILLTLGPMHRWFRRRTNKKRFLQPGTYSNLYSQPTLEVTALLPDDSNEAFPFSRNSPDLCRPEKDEETTKFCNNKHSNIRTIFPLSNQEMSSRWVRLPFQRIQQELTENAERESSHRNLSNEAQTITYSSKKDLYMEPRLDHSLGNSLITQSNDTFAIVAPPQRQSIKRLNTLDSPMPLTPDSHKQTAMQPNKKKDHKGFFRMPQEFFEMSTCDGCWKTTGRSTRYYFGNLCFANFLLAALAMPYTVAVCLGSQSSKSMTKTASGIGEVVNRSSTGGARGYSRNFVHPDHSLLPEPLWLDYTRCSMIETIVSGLTMAMIVCLVQLTADRLFAVCRPLHYARAMTRRRSVINILAGWLACFIFSGIPHLWALLVPTSDIHEATSVTSDVFQCFILGQHADGGHRYYVIAYFIIVYTLPVIFITTAYFKMYLMARRLARQFHFSQVTSPQPIIPPDRHFSDPFKESLVKAEKKTNLDISRYINKRLWRIYFGSSNGISHRQANQVGLNKRQTKQMAETKAAKTAFCLVATFIALTFPYFIFIIYTAIITKEKHNPELRISKLPLLPSIPYTLLSKTFSASSFFSDGKLNLLASSESLVNSSHFSNKFETSIPQAGSGMLTLETQNIYSERDKSFTDLQEVIRSVSVWLLYVNSTLTPIVYANRDGVLRRRFLSFWTFERRSKKSQDTSENEVNGIRPGVTMTRSGGQNERQRLPLTGYVCANAEE